MNLNSRGSVQKYRLQMYLRWIPTLLWMAIIFYLSHQPATSLNKMLPYFNKLFPAMVSFNWGHFLAYFILAITFYWGIGNRYSPFKRKVLIVVLCTIYGVTDEYHQLYVEGRHFDVLDIRNDAIGATLGMLFISIRPINRMMLKMSAYCEK